MEKQMVYNIELAHEPKEKKKFKDVYKWVIQI